MKNFFIFILIGILVSFITGFITYSDCRDCAEDFPYKNYSSIQVYVSPRGLPVATFTYCYEGKDYTKCHPNLK